MKKQTFITLSILLCILIGCKEKKYFPDTAIVYSGTTLLPMPDGDFWRKITGFDSIQLIVQHDNLIEANFCYPNKWEFNKWHKDTVYIHDTIYKNRNTNIGSANTVNIGQ